MEAFYRPSTLPLTVWRRVGNIRIEDLTPDRKTELLNVLKTDYFRDEPLSKSKNVRILEDPVGLNELVDYWEQKLKQNTVVVAIDEDTNRVAGFNVGNFYYKPAVKPTLEESLLPFKTQSARNFFELLMYINIEFDAFAYYKTDLIADSVGLSVFKPYRGKGLAEELLKARFDLARACGITAAKTTFSGAYSTKAGYNAGMELLAEIKYEDYKKDGEILYPDMGVHKSLVTLGKRL